MFELDPSFVESYKSRVEPFGFGGLGALVYQRTYSRKIAATGENERWYQTVARVVNGVFKMQYRHITAGNLGWKPDKAQRTAKKMYDMMFNMKFLGPGRGLWAMGSEIIEERGLHAALNNCAFVSTQDIGRSIDDFVQPFCFLNDMSMLGVGVGFDTKGNKKALIQPPGDNAKTIVHFIDDSREGWVEGLRQLLISYHNGEHIVQFDYSRLRPYGEPIKGFGGVASGPEPLKQMFEAIRKVLHDVKPYWIRSRQIVDIMNLIGVCVVAGNVRR